MHLNIADVIPAYRDDINSALTHIYPQGPKSLTSPVNYVLNGRGKRIRPLLAIFVAEACGGKKEDVFSAALAVEVLHNFTLVHDDIMDQDQMRHGQPTVHHKWDDGIAILTGDAMLSLALKLLNKSPSGRRQQIKKFIDGLLAVCEGQAMDKEFETMETVSLEDYQKMIDLKTGYMLGLAAEMGAISAGRDEHTINAIGDYGRLIGRAFQIQDDYLEIFSDSSNMGKSLKSDIILGKKTYLMIQAHLAANSEISSAIKLAQNDFSKGISEIRIILEENGIKEKTENEIQSIITLADNKISTLNIDKERLLYFSKLIHKRGN
ncbi:MAG: polyprenyl synthetase family protein [Candidatus Marinimicrobia bacterium]|nr:polyprenyl synthetase family protein [Candidatus Neomarinimicrobiota bacterium]